MDPSEEERYRFGPMGIAIAFKRPGLFVWSRQNSTEVVLTSRRLYGQGRMPWFSRLFHRGDTPVFDVPLPEIVAIEPVDFLANRAVWIRYQSPTGEKGVAIIAGRPLSRPYRPSHGPPRSDGERDWRWRLL